MRTLTLRKPPVRQPTRAVSHSNHGQRFLVCYDSSLASRLALKTALGLAMSETEIIAISFIVVPRSQPATVVMPNMETPAEVDLAAAVTNARLRGFAIQTEIIQCHDIGDALLARASECSAEAIFIGVERREFEEELDSVAAYLLRCAAAKVFVVAV